MWKKIRVSLAIADDIDLYDILFSELFVLFRLVKTIHNNALAKFVGKSSFLFVKMFASLTGIADKFSSFIREPVTPLGNCVHDTIYTTSYGNSNYKKVCLLIVVFYSK